MSVELKVFCGAYFPKDKALKKTPDLKPLAIAVNALNKGIAEAVIFGKLAAEHPEHIDDYFKVKIWEHREGLPCPELDVFSHEFFGVVAEWNVNAGEPAAAQQPETNEKDEWDYNKAQEEIKTVARLDQASRAACLALFGSVSEITAAQYGQIVDLVNDDAGGYTRELAEALTKETRALALSPERQEQLLAWVRENTKETAQWPDIKKQIAKWIDTPVDKRPLATSNDQETTELIRTDSGARLCTGAPSDRAYKHSKEGLGNEIAKGLIAREREFDIYASQPDIFQQAEKIRLSGTHEEYEAWYRIFITTPGGMDFSKAINIAVVKTAPPELWKDPVKHREYFNRVMTECDHSNPDPLIVDIACGRSSSPMPGAYLRNTEDDETQPPVQDKTDLPAVCPGRAAQLDKELNEAFEKRDSAEQHASEQPQIENLGGGVFSVDALINTPSSNEVEKQEVPPALTAHEIEIAHALNELIAGRTRIMGKDEAEGVVAATGYPVSHVIPLLLADIGTAEFCLSPDFSDEEIHDVATTILDSWSDDLSVRQKIALDAIVEYRRPAPPKAVVIEPPAITAKPKKVAEPVPESQPATLLNYRQQLILAAIQGMCANPSYRADFDDLPAMAIELADSVINQEGF